MFAQNHSTVAFGFKKVAALSLAVSVSLLMAACGESGTEPKSKVATEDLSIPPNATTAQVFYGAPVSYPNGIPDLGIDTAVTLTLSANTTDTSKTNFLIKNGVDSVTGTLSYGSTAKSAALSIDVATWTSIFSTVPSWIQFPVSIGVEWRTIGLAGTLLQEWVPGFEFRIGNIYSAPYYPTYTICVGAFGTISVAFTESDVCTFDLGTVGVVDGSGAE
jgi:hypothetical protein